MGTDDTVDAVVGTDELAANVLAADDDARPRFGVADLVIAIVIGLLFAAAVWTAVGNLVGIPQVVAVARAGTVPWVTLVGAVVLPVVLFAAAVLAGRGRPTFDRALILVVAVAANSAASLTLYFLSLRVLGF